MSTSTELPAELHDALLAAARTPRLLVASDYDGTVSPIVSDPAAAHPHPAAIAALRELGRLPDTAAALISGRPRAVLAELSGLDGVVELVGSHGSEFADGFVQEIDADRASLLDRVVADLYRAAESEPGATVEVKPAGATLHVRNVADEERGDMLLDIVRMGSARWPGVHPTEGKRVIELSVIDTDKGYAIDALRTRSGADRVIFLGDDVTDEKAFRRLGPDDIGVKVGDGETAANYRVPSVEQVAAALAVLLDRRRAVIRSPKPR